MKRRKRRNQTPSSFQTFRQPARNALLDSWVIIAVIFVFALLSMLGFVMMTSFNDAVQEDTASFSNSTQSTMSTLNTVYPRLMDGLFLLLFVGLAAGGIATVFFLDTHPIFLFITFFGLIFMFLTGAFFGNAVDSILQDAEFTTVAANFPMSIFIMTHLLEVSVGLGLLLGIILFAKLRS